MSNIILTSLMALLLDAPSDSIQKSIELNEVEVVASVRETESVRKQPASYSIISGKQLLANHVTSLKGITGLVPNFFMPDYGSRLTSAVYIRGIGSRINTPAVGMYVDNVPYVDKSAFDFNFYDIERIDVLRGPQGTLYGRNAMGGIVNVYTRNPFSYSGTDLSLGYATGDNHRTASLTHYHHFGDKFAFSAGGYYEGGDGFFRNSLTGNKADGIQAGGGRWRGILNATERLTFDLTASYDYSDEKAYPYFYTGSLTDVETYPDFIGKITANHEGKYRRSLFNAGLNIEYRAPLWQMNAVTGFQNLNDRMFMDQDFVAADIYTLEQKQRINTLTEEVTIKSTGDSMWQDVSGLSFMYQWLNTEAPVMFYNDGVDWLTSLVNQNMPDVSKIQSLSRMGFTNMAVNFRDCPMNLGGVFDTPTLSLAVFRQTTANFGDHLSATVGLRLDYEHNTLKYDAQRTLNYGFTLANPRAPMMNVDLQNLSSQLSYLGTIKNDYIRLLPKFSLKYQFDNDNNIYVTVAEGMRSGGYNVQMFSELLQGQMRSYMMDGIKTGVADYLKTFISKGMPESVIGSVINTMNENMPKFDVPDVEQVVYKPEYSWNYELGTHLTLPSHTLAADAAVFYIRTTNQQIARFADSGMGRRMVNAGVSQSIGAELSVRWMPVSNFTLMGNYGYTNSTFVEYNDGTGADYKDNKVPFVPEHTANLDAAYSWFFKSGCLSSLTLGANYMGAGRIYWTEDNSHSQAFYSQLGARISAVMPHFTVTVWGKNLTQSHYNTFYFQSASRGFEQHCKPLQVGVDVKIAF